MVEPGRSYSAGNQYMYGFNGKEQDNEVSGQGNQYDYGFRIYNPRLGKFLSVDPLFKSFPWNGPYSYAEGDVIRSIDLDGLEKYVVTYWYDHEGNHRKTTIKAIRTKDTKEIMDMKFSTANGGDLTDKEVWVRHLYLNGRQKEQATGKGALNTSEQALFNKAVTKSTKKYIVMYDFGDEKGGIMDKSKEFANVKYEYREATKIIPLKVEDNKTAFTFADPDGDGRFNTAITVDDQQGYVAAFKNQFLQKYPNATNIKLESVIITIQSLASLPLAEKTKKFWLNIDPNVKIDIVTDPKFVNTVPGKQGEKPSSRDVKSDYKFSGMILTL